MQITDRDALLIVDVQKDFCQGGSLAVPQGDMVVPKMNEYIRKIIQSNGYVYLSRDWHPQDHLSFLEQEGPWPMHCVVDSEGAKFHDALALPDIFTVVSKGTESDKEAYSAFQGTTLSHSLKKQGIERLFIGGLATDVCVRDTVLDAIQEGFKVLFLQDASRGVTSEGTEETYALFKSKGIGLICLDNLT